MTVLTLVKLITDEQKGLTLERVSTRRRVVEAYEYCAYRIAHAAKAEVLSLGKAHIYEGDELVRPRANVRMVDVMAHASAITDCCYALDDIADGMRDDADNHCQLVDGYNIPPYGEGSMFGYDGPTAAWLLLHPTAPAIITRYGDDDLDEWVSLWFDHWLHNPTQTKWPTNNRINEAFEIPVMPANYSCRLGQISRQHARIALKMKRNKKHHRSIKHGH